MRDKLLEVIEQNSRLSTEQIAVMLGVTEFEVSAELKKLEEENIILGYHTLINWEKTDQDVVSASIEVKVTPQRDLGFDKIAERIYLYPEVKSVYLMSGSFDLTVLVEGKTMKEVALFVSEKLAPMDSVESCATHFILKKYKQDGFVFDKKETDERPAIWL